VSKKECRQQDELELEITFTPCAESKAPVRAMAKFLVALWLREQEKEATNEHDD